MPIANIVIYFAWIAAVVAFVLAGLSLPHVGAGIHPLLGDTQAGLVFLLCGITMVVFAIFPRLIYRLTKREKEQHTAEDDA